jgi:hypothetical protein
VAGARNHPRTPNFPIPTEPATKSPAQFARVGLHEFSGTNPGRRLLGDLAEGMEVSQPPLLPIASFEHFLCNWLDFGEVA